VIVDYLQLMQGRGRYDSRQQEISEISRSLKEMAKELNIPILALSQLSRAPEQRGTGEKRPQLSDLRESGAIEQDADVVLFLFREEIKKDDPDLKGKAQLIIGKQRNGPTGTVDLHFIREFTSFVNPEWRDS
jgi:replicative DNA helicase